MKAKEGTAMQVRDSVEVFKTFADQVWTPERAGFLDVVLSDAIRRSGLGSYKGAPEVMGEPGFAQKPTFCPHILCR